MIRARCLALLGWACLCSGAIADDLWLATLHEFPGRLRISEGGTVPRIVHSRSDHPDPAYPRAVMKIAHVAVGPDGAVYYCSGLDGSLMHLLNGRHEIQSVEVAGQIRDLACTGEEHTVYYSVVATPQDGASLSDGYIYRRDFWAGSAELVAEIRQADVGGNWWGNFAIRDGEIYLISHDRPSRIHIWSGGSVRPAHLDNRYSITGLSVAANGHFVFTDGSGQVWETENFVHAQQVLQTTLELGDVAVRAAPDSRRP